MSKSLGNVIDPLALVNEYGADALRFYLAGHVHPFEDSDFTMEKFKEAYNADLANGIGNLTSRIMKMAVTHGVKEPQKWPAENQTYSSVSKSVHVKLDAYAINQALQEIMGFCQGVDGTIAERKPYSLIKTAPEEGREAISILLANLNMVATLLEPFLPSTSQEIHRLIREHKMPEKPLFPRK